MSENDIDEELAKSIEKLVEEETNVARAFVGGQSEEEISAPAKGNQNMGATQMFDRDGIEKELAESARSGERPGSDTRKWEEDADFLLDEEEEDWDEEKGTGSRKEKIMPDQKDKKKLSKKNKIIIAGVSALVAVIVIAIIVTAVILNNKNKKSYDYNITKGMEYYNAQNFDEAKKFLKNAYSTGKGKKDADLMYALYECYMADHDEKSAVEMLQNLLSYDKKNEKGITALAKYYYGQKDGAALTELIKKYKGTAEEKYLTEYEVAAPVASETSGEYQDSLQLNLLAEDGCRIYYTTDEKEPTIKSTEFKDEISLSQGTVILKAIAVNEIGVCSEIAEYKYEIDFKQPDAPEISPESGSYEVGQLVSIDNLKSGDKAFYTLDGTTPTANSTPYTGPFELKEGSIVVSVVIISEHDLSSTVTRRNYEVTEAKTYTYSEAETLLKNRMIALNLVKSDGKTMTNGGMVSFVYQSKKTIDNIEMYYIRCDVKRNGVIETQGYYGVGLKNGQCYKVTESSGKFSAVQY